MPFTIAIYKDMIMSTLFLFALITATVILQLYFVFLTFFSSMATLQNDIEEIAYDLFVNLPLSPRPADLNWDQIRAQRQAQLRELLGVDVNQDN